jgi:hypothetical protein
MRLPSTCAKCQYGDKLYSTVFTKPNWRCYHSMYNGRRIPCRPGQLPKVPARCPRRKA